MQKYCIHICLNSSHYLYLAKRAGESELAKPRLVLVGWDSALAVRACSSTKGLDRTEWQSKECTVNPKAKGRIRICGVVLDAVDLFGWIRMDVVGGGWWLWWVVAIVATHRHRHDIDMLASMDFCIGITFALAFALTGT